MEVGEAGGPSKEPVVVLAARRAPMALDVGIDVAASVTKAGLSVLRTGMRWGRPVAGLVLRPRPISREYWPHTRLMAMAERGRAVRVQGETQVSALVSYLVPAVMETVLERVDLTQLVIDHVQIDRIVDSIDLDEIVGKIDVGSIIGRLDMMGIAHEVIDGVDLPEIIRESSGAMASETVVGVRMAGIEADERISRIVDRLMLRRRARPQTAENGVEPDDSV
jgi:hypothetical protein